MAFLLEEPSNCSGCWLQTGASDTVVTGIGSIALTDSSPGGSRDNRGAVVWNGVE